MHELAVSMEMASSEEETRQKLSVQLEQQAEANNNGAESFHSAEPLKHAQTLQH